MLSKQRTDEYGGSLENCMRFPLEVYGTVHSVYSADKPVTVRVWETDWVEGGWDIDQIIEFAKVMERRKYSAIHVSTGGLDIN